MVRGRKPRLSKWLSSEAMVAAVIISIVRPGEGGKVAPTSELQEGGVNRVRLHRRAM